MDPVFAKQIEDKFAFFENQIANQDWWNKFTK